MKKIILASESPRRKLLMQQMGLEFSCLSANITEDHSLLTSPQELAKELARQKVLAVSHLVNDAIIIAADTIVVKEGIIMGKPQDESEAFRFLSSLSGSSHQVITGICILDIETNTLTSAAEMTVVYFRELTKSEITSYIASGEPLDKAGGYGIQGLGAMLVERIEGCYSNVVGLPLSRLYLMLKEKGIDCLGGSAPNVV